MSARPRPRRPRPPANGDPRGAAPRGSAGPPSAPPSGAAANEKPVRVWLASRGHAHAPPPAPAAIHKARRPPARPQQRPRTLRARGSRAGIILRAPRGRKRGSGPLFARPPGDPENASPGGSERCGPKGHPPRWIQSRILPPTPCVPGHHPGGSGRRRPGRACGRSGGWGPPAVTWPVPGRPLPSRCHLRVPPPCAGGPGLFPESLPPARPSRDVTRRPPAARSLARGCGESAARRALCRPRPGRPPRSRGLEGAPRRSRALTGCGASRAGSRLLRGAPSSRRPGALGLTTRWATQGHSRGKGVPGAGRGW